MAKPHARFGMGRERIGPGRLSRCGFLTGIVISVALAATGCRPVWAQEEGEAVADVPALLNQAAEQRRLGNLTATLDVLRQASRAVKADPSRGDKHPDNMRVLDMAARTLVDLERYRAALGPLKRVAGLREEANPSAAEDRLALAETLIMTATCLAAGDSPEQAGEVLARARSLLAGTGTAPEARRADAAVAAAAVDEMLGNAAAAAAEFATVVSTHARSLGDKHPAVAAAIAAGPRLGAAPGRDDETERAARAALERLDLSGAGGEQAAVPLLRLLGQLTLAQDRYSEAEALFDRALGISTRQAGAAHPQTLLDRGQKSRVMLLRGKTSEAVAMAEELAAKAEALAAADDGRAGAVLRQLGDVFLVAGRTDRAETMYATARDLDVRVGGDAALAVTDDLLGLGRCALARGDAAAAKVPLEEAMKIRDRRGTAADETSLQLNRERAAAAALAGDIAAMEPLLQAIMDAKPARRNRVDDERLSELFDRAAAAYESAGDAARGRKVREQLLQLRADQHGANHPHVADVSMSFAIARQAAGAWDDAINYYRRALAMWEAGPTKGDGPEVAAVLMPMAECLRATDRPTEARAALERAHAIWVRTLGPGHEVTRTAKTLLDRAGGDRR